MRYLALLATSLVLISGCMFAFDGPPGSGGDDDDCLIAEPAIAPAPLRNPQTLTCDSFGSPCNPECGPCPELIAEVTASDITSPLPPWGICDSPCEGLSEAACTQNTACRVVRDAECAVSPGCTLDFIGCFPTSQVTRTDIDCFSARDGFTCSESSACTAYHRASNTASASASAGLTSPPPPQRTLPFAMCAPEGKSPGRCYAPVSCDLAAPACPTNTTPGIANGCYTGACIPTDVCGPVPQQ
jgi:hypothetical protein